MDANDKFFIRNTKIEKQIGNQLSTARAKKGYSIQDIHNKTHIKSKYLQDIENGQLTKLPHDYFFVKNFIYQYAKVVGVDKASIRPSLDKITPDLNNPYYQRYLNNYDVKHESKETREKSHAFSIKHKLTVSFYTVLIFLAIACVYGFVFQTHDDMKVDPVKAHPTTFSGEKLRLHKLPFSSHLKKVDPEQYKVTLKHRRDKKVTLKVSSEAKNALTIKGKHFKIHHKSFKHVDVTVPKDTKVFELKFKHAGEVHVKINGKKYDLKNVAKSKTKSKQSNSNGKTNNSSSNLRTTNSSSKSSTSNNTNSTTKSTRTTSSTSSTKPTTNVRTTSKPSQNTTSTNKPTQQKQAVNDKKASKALE